MNQSVVIIGSGFAGLSAASFMAKAGWNVTVIEKNAGPGGRARQLKSDGFTFDMGPSWYWMPEVYENFFSQFGKKVSDYYSLQRLDPSYRIYWNKGSDDIPAQYVHIKAFFDSLENGSGEKLELFLRQAETKYRLGMGSLVYKPGLSVREFFDRQIVKNIFKLDVFR